MFAKSKLLRGRKPLLQFRAGKMYQEGKLVKPDARKGILTLVPDTSGVMEIIWTSTDSNTEEQTMVFRGSATFNRVEKCTTGRVFVLDFGQRQLFWWLQEPSTERDEEYLKAVKLHIGDSKDSQGRTTASNRPADAAMATSPTPDISMDYLQNILSNLSAPAPPGTQQQQQQAPPPAFVIPPRMVDLQGLISSPEVLSAIREDPSFYMSRVCQHLPEGTDPSTEIAPHIRNPQVSSAARLLQAALHEADGFREITAAFRIPPGQGSDANGIGAGPFLERIEQEARKGEEESNQKDKNEEEK